MEIAGEHIVLKCLSELPGPVDSVTPVILKVNAGLNDFERHRVFLIIVLFYFVIESAFYFIVRFEIIGTSGENDQTSYE